MIVRATGEDFPPRFGVGWRQIVAVRQLVDFLRSQAGEKFAGKHAEERVSETVDSLEMFEEKDEALEMRGLQFAVDAVKRVGHRVGNALFLEITLQLENVVAHRHDLSVLRSPKHELVELQACHPRFFASHRYIAYAKLLRVEPHGAKPYELAQASGR